MNISKIERLNMKISQTTDQDILLVVNSCCNNYSCLQLNKTHEFKCEK